MYNLFIKRFFDIVLSIILLIPITAIIIILSILVYVVDFRNPFYVSDRLGKDMKKFPMFKIRTMKVNAEDIRNSDGSTFNSKRDARVTKIGYYLRKFSLDELPQIYNVLFGHMSFIGPRPDLYNQSMYYSGKSKIKFKVKPGITGYAQVNGRNSLDWNEKIILDEYYVDNISMRMDLAIFVLTIFKVLKSKEVNKYD
jgi:lipopolysaccharide/colanic/teichoic acid biosynthesis glycosyltransferase